MNESKVSSGNLIISAWHEEFEYYVDTTDSEKRHRFIL